MCIRDSYNRQRQAKVYREYQAALKKNNALDFDDLIMKTVELFRADAEAVSYTHLDVYKRQTPALNDEVAAICLEACKTAKKMGVKISCCLLYTSRCV